MSFISLLGLHLQNPYKEQIKGVLLETSKKVKKKRKQFKKDIKGKK